MTFSILLSFIGEGATDNRFIPNIAERLVEELLLEQNKEAIILWQPISKSGNDAASKILSASKQAKYCTTLIVHADADDDSTDVAMAHRIQPGLDAISNFDGDVCENITIVIPVTETEAWMLVDKDLLKEEMNSQLSNQDLGLTYQLSRIETIADPKQKLQDAIHIHRQSLKRRRRRSAVLISELYEPISQRISLQKLEVLSAYNVFKENLITALRNKNILN